jgi:hypothetical protein
MVVGFAVRRPACFWQVVDRAAYYRLIWISCLVLAAVVSYELWLSKPAREVAVDAAFRRGRAHAESKAEENGKHDPSSSSDAMRLLIKVREGMTFDEAAKVVPLSDSLRGFAGEHGGVWYDVPLGGEYFISLRFEHPEGDWNSSGKSLHKCKINFPPRLAVHSGGIISFVATNGVPP